MKQLTSAVLKSVSRSFYLSLKVLPSAVRPAIAHAYLLARAADTIADTRLIDRRLRVTHLLALREELDAAKPGRLEAIVAATRTAQSLDTERTLLERLPDCLAGYRALAPDDRRRVRSVLGTIIEGMTEDLTRFPGEDEGGLAALEKRADLDRYTYLVAGCVGEFWTEVHVAHRPRLRHWDLETMAALGIRFGKALQLTNVLSAQPRSPYSASSPEIFSIPRPGPSSVRCSWNCSTSPWTTTRRDGATPSPSPAGRHACAWPAPGRFSSGCAPSISSPRRPTGSTPASCSRFPASACTA